ncbi:hypothetical protein Terro_2363 [Terriglobus roseus DSM 18391]|uniref:Uncharacterized protein n=1 Tax=Terriglobus roseus (strain DSM 18391 / NRRL B-41598 / KBS 63) TaxID=926566 RepID=I3ZGB5_TERRK|nr:hypothetical protein [Terriglobus roseus]AFL88283.1 hypothetical protein Terro_1997 [Terriglobus roseus DSM 18391]AFL88624.1 hypothetical protein Terro_2363 [Terriglobus roseus DSM 18391]
MKASHLVRPAVISTVLLTAVSLGIVLPSPSTAFGQANSYPNMRQNQTPSNIPNNGRGMDPSRPGNSTYPLDSSVSPDFPKEIVTRREAARKLERKRRMVDSANRLLELTEQLRAQLATREATPEDAKRLDDIARLARSVKDQMRD